MSYIRLYLVPQGGVQQVIDVDASDLVLSAQAFVSPQTAPTVTLVGASIDSVFTPFSFTPVPPGGLSLVSSQQQEVRVCWREPVGTEDYPNQDLIVVPDPSGGMCTCGITCSGTDLTYVQVQAVA